MGRKNKVISLDGQQLAELTEGYKSGKKDCFRRRCHAVVLKSGDRTSKEVGYILGMNQVTVNVWVSRYGEEGIDGLMNRPGQGRRPILDPERDMERIRRAVTAERQRLGQARELLEAEMGKGFSLKTLKRFLKKTTAVTSVSG